MSPLSRVRWAGIAVCFCLAGCAGGADSQSSSLSDLEQQFRTVPIENRRLMGPLFWLHGDESRQRLEMYVAKVAEAGNGSFTAESRPHVDWLGEGWWRDLKICLDAAKQHNLYLWIFDEKWWPSGEVGGKVPPEYGAKTMVASSETIEGPTEYGSVGFGGPQFIAAIAGKDIDGRIDGSSLVDLSSHIRNGNLNWSIPQGKWRLMKFTWRHTGGGRILVDGASQDCVDWYIKTVYQPHYDHFSADFGKTIRGYFYDEPETPGDWGTEVPKLLKERGIDWKKAYVAWKFQLAGEEQPAAKYQYQDAFAEAWGRTMYGGITRWCRDHNVRSIGHWLEHANCYLHPHLCAGNMFQVQKYSDMGAIDAVFRQFAIGKRVANDPPCWQTPKLGSSITHAYGKEDDLAMVEIYGARGQDLGYYEMKWWLDHMQVSGINFIIPHSFNPKSPYDTDCPPYFYNGGYEPRFPLYRVLADYSSRLTTMLTGGRHVCPVALLYLGNSSHVGRFATPEQMSEALQDALYDCDWIPYDVLENDMHVSGKELRLRNERYRVLIVPPVEVIPYDTLKKVKDFFESGGVVIGHGILPSKSATLGKTSAEIATLVEAIWGSPVPTSPVAGVRKTSRNGGRSYFLPQQVTPEQLQQVLAEDAGVRPTLEVIEGQTDHWLHILHRVKDGHDVFFIVNQNHEGDARTFKFRATADGYPECWDPMRNEINSIPFNRANDKSVEFDLVMEPNEATLIVFNSARRNLPPRIERSAQPAGQPIEVARQPVQVEWQDPPPKSATGGVSLAGCPWIWFPEGQTNVQAEPGTRFFRKAIEIPQNRKLKSARARFSVDNSFILFVNEKKVGEGNDWHLPTDLDLTESLKPGRNVLAIQATNGVGNVNPAGVVGSIRIDFEQGEPMLVKVDGSWKSAKDPVQGWTALAFDDSTWPAAKETAMFGDAPWGLLGEEITRSPVKPDPFVGTFTVSSDLGQARAYLEMVDVPISCAAVTVNGKPAGGVLGGPMRVNITSLIKAGENRVEILPLAPRSARVVFYR